MSDKEKNDLIIDEENSLPFDFFDDNQEEDQDVKNVKDEKVDVEDKKEDHIVLKEDVKEQKSTSSTIIEAASFSLGQILQEARVKKNLSLDQVSQTTKINKNFIEDLEQDDASNLPSSVYVSAYIKTLATLYQIDHENLLAHIKDYKLKNSVSTSLLSHLEDNKQINFKEEHKVKKIITNLIVSISLIAIIIFLLLYLFSPSDKSTKKITQISTKEKSEVDTPSKIKSKISSKDLEVFIYPKPLTMTELPIPEK